MPENKDIFNVVLANATLECDNKGCSALAYSSLILLDDIFSALNLKYNLFLKTWGRTKHLSEFDGKITLETVNLPYPSSLKGWIRNIVYYKDFKKSYNAFKNADLLLDLGEGDSFSDIYGESRFRGIVRSTDTASRFNIPYALLPQTIGPFKSENVRKAAVSTMNKASLVMVRDNASLQKVKEYDPSLQAKEYIDLAFLLPYKKYQFDQSRIHVGLNVSSLLWNGGYTKDNQFGLAVDYPKLILGLIDDLLKKDEKIVVHLVPHVYGLDKGGIENDFSVMTDIYKRYNHPRLVLAPLAFDPMDVKSYIAGMDFFMGARMHATIAAFSSGVPVVPMAYSRKFNGLFADTLQYPHMVDLKSMNEGEVRTKILSAFDDRNHLADTIQNRLKNVVAPRLKNLKEDLTNIVLSIINENK